MTKRFDELDSLRGLAALTVLVHHFLLVLTNEPKLLNEPPLYILSAGYEAVIFFFILSGFVLSLPFYSPGEKKFSYWGFIVKRFCRIYIPYALAVLAAVLLDTLFYKGAIPELSAWFNNIGQAHVQFDLVFKHLILIDSFKNYVYDPVLWSLVHEMRISILFPFIMYFILKYNWKTNLIAAILLSIIGYEISRFVNNSINIYDLNYDYFMTLRYVAAFVFGALFAKHRQFIFQKYLALDKRIKYLLLFSGILAFINASWFDRVIYKLKLNQIEFFTNDIGVALGVLFFITIALTSKKVSSFLLSKIVHYLGKISYSLYLYHSICLFTLFHILFGILPIWSIFLISFVASFAVASVSYKFVELPSIRLGKYLSGRITDKISIKKGLQHNHAKSLE